MSVIAVLFVISGLLIFYSYVGYPVLLWVMAGAMVRRVAPNRRGTDPKVTLLISVYNEEQVIDAKIRNSLSLMYPKDLLEIVVVSDGSDDRTHDIVTRYADQGVRLRQYEGRRGKTACLNLAVPSAEGAIVVFSDANSHYDRMALKKLVDHFQDPETGFVTGVTHYRSEGHEGLSKSIGLYWKLEQSTKVLESDLGSCVGADGAMFAIRKELYRPLKSYDINDLVIPLNVIEQGFRGRVEPEAVCLEDTAAGSRNEFRRQVRITNRTIRAIINYRHVLNPFRYGFFSFELWSHKACRMLVPFALAIFLLTNVALMSHGVVYQLTFCGQMSAYLLALVGHLNVPVKLVGLSKLVSIAQTFMMANLAILVGWIQYARGQTNVTWMPSRK